VLQYLPKADARRPEYVAMLETMAAALKKWQGADGLWRSDLTHPMAFPNPETSGTGFITFAMAWGINNAILDRATYLPVVRAGWQGLVDNVDANGKLGYVQGVGAGPAAATPTSTVPYRRRSLPSRRKRSRQALTPFPIVQAASTVLRTQAL
jgi:unsaturated rhamnogalacturonyl hydrolase